MKASDCISGMWFEKGTCDPRIIGKKGTIEGIAISISTTAVRERLKKNRLTSLKSNGNASCILP
jgi:hypothetical protein